MLNENDDWEASLEDTGSPNYAIPKFQSFD